MVFSRYNILYCSNGSYKLYNSRSNFYANISKELFDTLSKIKVTENFSLESLNIPQDLLKKLLDSKVIVNPYDDDDFYNLKKYLRYNHAFSKLSLGLIIVPTLACNFKCPYCYETKLSHKTMNTSTMEQIIKFVENSGCKTVNLCWHGGEPLLAFENMFSGKKCHDCAFLPLCDGGCVVRRYNQYHGGEEYDSCPLDKEDFFDLLEMKLKMDCL